MSKDKTDNYKIVDIKEFDSTMMQATIVKPDGSKCLTTFPKYPTIEYDKLGKIKIDNKTN
jgi:hypothetical protein